MQVLALTRSMRLILASATLAIPLSALQVITAHALPWWKVPLARIVGASALAGVVCFIVTRALARNARWPLVALPPLVVTWGVGALAAAYLLRSPGLAFCAAITLALGALLVTAVDQHWSQAAMDPRASWFEGRPRVLPHLSARLGGEAVQSKRDLSVVRLDSEGIFVIGTSGALTAGVALPIELTFREREVQLAAKPYTHWSGTDVGAGFRFEGLEPQQRKQLGDLIEQVRGEGYEP